MIRNIVGGQVINPENNPPSCGCGCGCGYWSSHDYYQGLHDTLGNECRDSS